MTTPAVSRWHVPAPERKGVSIFPSFLAFSEFVLQLQLSPVCLFCLKLADASKKSSRAISGSACPTVAPRRVAASVCGGRGAVSFSVVVANVRNQEGLRPPLLGGSPLRARSRVAVDSAAFHPPRARGLSCPRVRVFGNHGIHDPTRLPRRRRVQAQRTPWRHAVPTSPGTRTEARVGTGKDEHA